MTKNSTAGMLYSPSGRAPIQYLIWPAVTGVPAVGEVLTSGAAAWGGQADIVAAADIGTEFFICGFFVDTAGAAQVFEVQVSDLTPTVLTEFRVDLTAVTMNLGYIPCGYLPIWMAADAQVQGRAGAAGTKVIGVTLLYAPAVL